MNRALTPPSAGQPISASFFAELLREIRANRPLAGKNTRTNRTPNGTHISAVAGPQLQSRKPDVGRFALCIDEENDVATFKNCYFVAGGKLYEMNGGPQITSNKIAALKVQAFGSEPNATYAYYDGIAALQAAQADDQYHIIPLYWFGDAASGVKIPPVKCDFRIGPDAIQAEYGSVTT